jgi:haloalkane dehalogenase
LRTPDESFSNLPDWPYEPVYTDVTAHDGTTLRIHHVDTGPDDATETVLCMHGEPTWSFLYRKMIPVLAGAGHRVVAPDLVGFGRSDKPTELSDYTYERHVDWMSQWLVKNNLRNITLVCQDWGSLIGLRLATAFPQRFSRIVLANGGLPTGDPPPNEAFLKWREFSQTVPVFTTAKIIEGGCVSKPLAPEVLAAYDAPYPAEEYKAGARIFPTLVPAGLDDPSSRPNRDAWEVLRAWTKPFVTMFSDSDPVTKNGEWAFRRAIPGCEGMPHTTIVGGGHFLQEDKGVEFATAINSFIARHH